MPHPVLAAMLLATGVDHNISPCLLSAITGHCRPMLREMHGQAPSKASREVGRHCPARSADPQHDYSEPDSDSLRVPWEQFLWSKDLCQLHIAGKTSFCQQESASLAVCCLQVPGSKSLRRLQARVSQHAQTAQQAFGGSPLRPSRGAQPSLSPSREPVAKALAARFDDSADNRGAGQPWLSPGGRCCTCPADGKAAANGCQAFMLHPRLRLQSRSLPHNNRTVELGGSSSLASSRTLAWCPDHPVRGNPAAVSVSTFSAHKGLIYCSGVAGKHLACP